jgi:starch synthase
MKELRHESNGLETLFEMEKEKSRGILNGIDTDVWNPQTDEFINHHYSGDSVALGKAANKKELCEEFGFDASRPLVSFIGRLVPQKGADLLPDLFTSIIEENADVNFVVLGTGNPELHEKFNTMSSEYVGFFDASLNYNEKLAHQIYAGSDFMIMPSRVEPCGLNQLYCMRYGTIPIVRNVGGLKDTVQDIRQTDGYGITFSDFTLQAAGQAIQQALDLYEKQEAFQSTRKKIMQLDFSWNVSAKTYIQMYHNVIARA